MAKAVHPIAVDVLRQVAGEQQVPCVTLSLSRASEFSQAGCSGRRPRKAGGSSVVPSAEKRGFGGVHVLFFAAVATLLKFGVPCSGVTEHSAPTIQIEFTARIVVEAAPKWLGNMAKAVHPIAVDVLLCTAGLVKRGIGGS